MRVYEKRGIAGKRTKRRLAMPDLLRVCLNIHFRLLPLRFAADLTQNKVT